MNFELRRFSWKTASVALVALYLASRLYALMALPVFVDEGIYVRWAREILQSGVSPEIFRDGKVLSMVVMAALLKLPGDPLLILRLASVLFGLGTLLLCMATGRRLYSRRVGLAAGFLYVITFYAWFYDRLALTDGFQTLFGALILLLSVAEARSPRGWRLLLLILALILAILVKFSSVNFLPIFPLAALILTPREKWRSMLPRAVFAAGLAAVFAVMLLSFGYAGMHFGAESTHKVASGLDLGALTAQIGINLVQVLSWLFTLLTLPLTILTLFAVESAVFHSRRREDKFLLAVLLSYTLLYLLLASALFSRYFHFLLVPLCLLLARYGDAMGSRLKDRLGAARRVVPAILGAALAIWPTVLALTTLHDPARAGLPPEVRIQFISGWPAGYGLAEIAAYLDDQASSTPGGINVARLFPSSPLHEGLDLYLSSSDSLSVYTLYPPVDLAAQLERLTAERRTLLVLNPSNDAVRLEAEGAEPLASLLADAELIWQYTRPGGESGLEVWGFPY